MKQIASNYAYSPATNVVTLTGVNIDADQLLLIVAPQVGRTMYNFASVTGSVAAGTDTRVTLNASTAGLTTTSPLVIFYDDQASAQAVTGTVALDPASLVALENITVTVGSSVALAAGSAQIGSVTVANFPASQTVTGTVTANVPLSDISGGIADYISGTDSFVVSPLGGVTFPISGTVKVANDYNGNDKEILVGPLNSDFESGEGRVGVELINKNGFSLVVTGPALNISGTVTASVSNIDRSITNLPSGALTTRFGSVVTANQSFITSAVTNTSRKYLLAQNISAGTVTIGIGFSPTTTQGIQLPAGGGLTFDAFCPTGAVYWLGAVTGAAYTILEG